MSAPLPRKLAAILSADAENFSGRMAENEAEAYAALRTARDLIDAQIAHHGGRIANTAGDGLIAEFPSVVQSVHAAVAIQQGLLAANTILPFRIGLHVGDVITHGEDLLGDGVNLAARVQAKASPGSILVTQHVFDQMGGKVDYGFNLIGDVPLKNMQDPVALYCIQASDVVPMTPLPDTPTRRAKRPAMPVKRLAMICSVVWGFLTLRSTLFDTSPAATWIGLAVAVVIITRLLSSLAHPKSEGRVLRPVLISVASAIALLLNGKWLFWLALPLAVAAAYVAVLKFVRGR